jgi:hypothetical protein
MLSKNHDIQKILFGDVVYNDDVNHYINLQYNAKDNDDFKNGKIFKIYQDISPNTILFISSLLSLPLFNIFNVLIVIKYIIIII